MGAGASSPEHAAAEVALLKARAAAVTRRAEADVAATQTRAEADAAASHARAQADVVRTRALRAALALGATAALVLAADVCVHESPMFIRRRMLRVLRACRLPPSVPAARPPLLPVPQAPLLLSFLPTMLLGPTGCGKSSLLAELARATVSAPVPAPVVLVRLRLPSSEREGLPSSASTAKVLMDSAAAQLYEQIGFPRRRSLLGALLSRGFTLQGQHHQAELTAPASGPRIIQALTMLFDVCAQLHAERVAAGLSVTDAAPVLLFDEVQDLIKDERLARAGGRDVFNLLGAQLIAHCVDRQEVRAAVAGSSAALDFAFAAASPARGNRWTYYDLRDPSPETVVTALQARGYTAHEAQDMVALCGTRLRLLQRPLSQGAEALSAAGFLEHAAATGREAFAKVFRLLDAHSKVELARVLDAVTSCDDVDTGAAASAGDATAAGSLLRPTREALPAAVRSMDHATILYVDRSSALYFQSQLHARAWSRVRGAYAQSAPALPLLQ